MPPPGSPAPIEGSSIANEDLPSSAQTQALRETAVSLALHGGRYVRHERPDEVSVAQTKSTSLDVVTAMDTGCERLLREQLAVQRPNDGILGEEGGLQAGTSGINWVIDPIDGTVNYLYGIPAYAVSVAAVVGDASAPGQWRPVAGAVSNPMVNEIFHAGAGLGACWQEVGPDGELAGHEVPLPGSAATDLTQALVGTGFGYDRDKRVHQGRTAIEVLAQVRDLRRIGAAALDLCAVAAGRLDAYYEWGLKPWDLAAGVLVCAESGMRVSGLRGQQASEVMMIASSPDIHADLHDLLIALNAGETAL